MSRSNFAFLHSTKVEGIQRTRFMNNSFRNWLLAPIIGGILMVLINTFNGHNDWRVILYGFVTGFAVVTVSSLIIELVPEKK